MIIEFGVMSSKWRMECEDLTSAKIAMCLFLEKNIPIAIYSPKEEAFSPLEFLKSKPNYNTEETRKALKSIEELK